MNQDIIKEIKRIIHQDGQDFTDGEIIDQISCFLANAAFNPSVSDWRLPTIVDEAFLNMTQEQDDAWHEYRRVRRAQRKGGE